MTIGLGSVADGHGTEIEIEHLEGDAYRPLFPAPLLVKEAAWKSVLAPGTYRLRLRALDKRGVPGPWSDYIQFKAKEPKVELENPAGDPPLPAGPATLTWRALPSASAYLLTVMDAQGETVATRKTTEPRASLSLPLGATYRWKVVAMADDGEPGEDGDARTFTLRGGALAAPGRIKAHLSDGPRSVSWQAPEHAESYAVTLEERVPDPTGWREIAAVKTQRDPSFVLPELKPGRYRVKVVAKASLWDDSPVRTREVRIAEVGGPARAMGRLRLYGRFLPTYWRHDATATGTSGISFDVIAVDAVQLGAELWDAGHALGLALDYRRIVATLFAGGVQAAGASDQQALPLPQQDLGLTAKARLAWRWFGIEGLLTAGQSSTYFFYNDSPDTITASRREWPYLGVGARATFAPTSRTEWDASFERILLLHGSDITLRGARVYSVEGGLVRRLAESLAVHATIDFTYKTMTYATAGPEGAGTFTDLTDAMGLGLDLLF